MLDPIHESTGLPSIAVIGAGVCGLGIGWRLAEAGCRVDVFDRGRAGRGASWAAAGMLAASAEAEPGEETLFALNRLSQKAWPAFARELTRKTGLPVGYRDEGTLVVATNGDDMRQLRHLMEVQRRVGLEPEWLGAAEVRRREPHLRPGIAGALYSPEDHQVDNRLLVEALRTAFLAAGGRLHEHAAVEGIDVSGGRARAVLVAGGRHAADVVVLAAGPWSRSLPGLPDALRPPVRPIKGQVLALRMDAAAPLIRHVVWAPKIYLVPRDDGRLIVGATVEERGFDETITAGGLLSLLEAAWRALPGIEELPIDEKWVGFRPGSRDDAPIYGPAAVDGLVYATGHHRNGILLAPVTADAVSRYVLTGELPEEIRPFTIARFAEKPQEAAA